MKTSGLSMLILFVTAACASEPIEPDVILTFEAVAVPTDTIVFDELGHPGDFSWVQPFAASSASPGAVRVVGSFLAPCSNLQSLNGEVAGEPNRLVLRVTAPTLNACADATRAFHYSADFSELSTGAYSVVVEHYGDVLQDVGGGGGDGVVFQASVTVR